MNCLSINVQGMGRKEKKDWVKLLCHTNGVNFLSIQETKMVSFDIFVVKSIWGNMLFDFATCSTRGRSGGTWMATNTNMLFMSIYVPQDLSAKRQLWSYILGLINRWHGEVVIMGEFNEVRFALERYGTTFHASHVDIFNSFITDSHWLMFLLVVILLLGLILHRHLSDHKPIFLRESYMDYGPTPFRLFHSWFLENDFVSVVEDA
ncbi:RNA-directed DNA polymerase, eukaryota [Tanacetum coccineum]